MDNTIGELNVRNRVGGGLHDEFPARDSSDQSHDFIDYTREPLTRPPFVSGNESSSELDDQASSFVSFDVIKPVLVIDMCILSFIIYRCLYYLQCLQCFDAVGWAAGRASGL